MVIRKRKNPATPNNSVPTIANTINASNICVPTTTTIDINPDLIQPNTNFPSIIQIDGILEDDCSDIGIDHPPDLSDDNDESFEATSSSVAMPLPDYKNEVCLLLKNFDRYKEAITPNNSYNNLLFHNYNQTTSIYYAAESKNLNSGIRFLFAQAFRLPQIADDLSDKEVRFHVLNTRLRIWWS
jgi:hypothetical protein